jgi:hypothetical protein
MVEFVVSPPEFSMIPIRPAGLQEEAERATLAKLKAKYEPTSGVLEEARKLIEKEADRTAAGERSGIRLRRRLLGWHARGGFRPQETNASRVAQPSGAGRRLQLESP